ncbi:MAG: chromosome segregation protein SMC [Actinomycetota bacterium]|nr:chromosome segregation protein SMC [Actinomycetota bacterium]
MYLKSLILKGFKSFADRTVMVVEPGVAVIVGPNGSGKSNISDAVLWVLGEQSAKSLRGQAMEDVIFAGSSARQAVGVAEVDLVLDNSDGTLPLEFHEVTITRRMFRNGESEYLINQSPCRLMDIHELLHDSGLGRDTHSIISQGRLDEVLNSRPEDRRALIEEAAGVLKHKKRKERALRKLRNMDAHLERVKDIVTEIDRQLRPLRKQADRATEHAGITADLNELEVSLAVDDLRELQVRWDDVLKREKEQDAEVELLRYRLKEKEAELGKFQSVLEEKGLFVGDLSEQRRRLQSTLERINSGLLLLEEKGKNLVDRLSELRAKLHHNQSRATARQAEMERLSELRSETDSQLKARYAQLGELRREAEAGRKERLRADEELASINGEMRRVRKEADDCRSELSRLEHALSAFKLEEDLLGDRASGIKDQRAGVQSTLSARRARLEQLESSLSHTRKQIALADSDVDKRVRVLESRKRDLAERRDRLTDTRAEIRGLEEVDRAFAAASPALAWALSKQKDLPGFIGPLTEHIKAAPAHEQLVERLLGGDLFALLVEDSKAAANVAASVRDNADGDISIVPVDRVVETSSSNSGDMLIDTIECDDRTRNALRALIGDVRLVDDLNSAISASNRGDGARYATPSGEVVWPSGKISIGRLVDDSASVLSRKRLINELHDQSSALTAAVGEAEAVTSAAEEALSAAQQDALELGQRLAATTGEHDSMREEVGRLEQALTALDADADRVAVRTVEISQRTAKDRPAVVSLKERIAEREVDIERLEEAAAVGSEVRESRFRDESAINERLSTCQVDIATVSEREVHLKRQAGAADADLRELTSAIEQALTTEDALEILRFRVQPVHDLYAALLERAEHWAGRLRDRARFEQADSESLRSTIHGAQEAVREVQTEIDDRSSNMSEVKVEKGQLEIQVTTAVGHIVDDLDVPLERALESEPIQDRQKTMDAAHRLRKRIANLGPVNPVAMQEFETLRERKEFLSSALSDLEGSRKALHKVIAAIDRKMRDRFVETFEQVDQHFQEVFAVLFPGGHSALRLTDPDNPEVTGVEVIAQPRGKKLAKMSLMSGGEKSLTALTLLFAVYRTRPCPLYILDEVEAALDDTNLRRFVAFVDSMRRYTQFVVVTHQRRTMEMADILYGVSMQADGVSKLVSQRLEQALEEATDDHAMV